MLDYVYGHDDIISRFVASLVPAWQGRELPPMMSTIGIVDKDGHLVAGVLYNNYDQVAGIIEISCAALPGSHWLTRDSLRLIHAYPFEQLGCQMVVARIAADDKRALRQLAAYNYAFVRVPRLFGRDRDAVLCLLTREAWEANKFNRRRELPSFYEAA
jgi:RimJ/RimL family protein N-acetyltransferase